MSRCCRPNVILSCTSYFSASSVSWVMVGLDAFFMWSSLAPLLMVMLMSASRNVSDADRFSRKSTVMVWLLTFFMPASCR